MAVVQEGAETLTRCDLCVMHMPEGPLIKHPLKEICNKNTQMRWRRQDVAIANKCTEAIFSLTVEDGVESVEGVQVLNYLGWTLYQSDYD